MKLLQRFESEKSHVIPLRRDGSKSSTFWSLLACCCADQLGYDMMSPENCSLEKKSFPKSAQLAKAILLQF